MLGQIRWFYGIDQDELEVMAWIVMVVAMLLAGWLYRKGKK